MAVRRYTFLFVCQQGELEIKALLLAASLRRFVPSACELVAAVPGPAEIWGAPRAATLRLLDRLHVRVAAIRNEIDVGYPIGNKVAALRVPCSTDKQVLLDSDMLCLRPFEDEPRFGIALNAKPSEGTTFSGDDTVWQQVYAICGLTPPTHRVRTTFWGTYTWPYFNAGFVAVDAGIGFGDAWLECCRTIDAAPATFKKRPWLDQIALPVAVHKLKLPYDCLDERYNYPAHRIPLHERRLPTFCHYHYPSIIRRERALTEIVQTLVEEHPDLGPILAEHAAWAPLLPAPRKDRSCPARPSHIAGRGAARPELIVTGIPRSGTSYLCNLLHRFDNCVVINEPGAVFAPLTREPLPWGVATFYRDVRRDILDGTPVRNKLVDGRITEDTLVSDERCDYTPRVANADFVLGMKNTLSFLNRLDVLRRVMPDARIVACVRNPFDTIASWKSSFRHLREADVKAIPIGHVNDPWLTGSQRAELENVASLPGEIERRAAYWNYLARLIIDSLDRLILVRYDDLVLRPIDLLSRILDGFDGGKLAEPVEPSELRSKAHEQLTPEDVQAIRALCSASAAELGVFTPFLT